MTRLIIIIPAAVKASANTASKVITGRAADEKTFDAEPLSATGAAPATHWMCSGLFGDRERAEVMDGVKNAAFRDAVIAVWDTIGQPDGEAELLKSLGLQRILPAMAAQAEGGRA